MIDAIRSEWIKFRSVRSTVILLLAGGGLTVLIALIAIGQADDGETYRLTDISGGVQLAVFLFGTLGVQILGQEYRFNTIRTTFTATPNRLKVVLAKVVVVAAACAAMAIVMLAVCVALGSMLLEGFELDGVDERTIWATALFAAGWATFGVAVAAIIRQPVAGIVVLLIEAFVLELILIGLVPALAEWMPFNNGFQMTYRLDTPSGGEEPELRAVLDGGIYFFAFTAGLLAIGAALVRRRDA